VGGKGGGGGRGGEMTQALYAHMNNKRKKKDCGIFSFQKSHLKSSKLHAIKLLSTDSFIY
jgi:hypothetical protein